MNKEQIKTLLILVFSIVIIISLRTCENTPSEEEEISFEEKMQVRKNKDSLNTAKIKVLETESSKNFIEIQSKNQEIIKLQNLVKSYQKQLKNQGSATILKTETKYVKEDVIYVDTFCGKCNFYYIDEDNWITTKILINSTKRSDSLKFSLNYKIKNDYQVVIGEESNGWFKKATPFVEVTNLNPYTETTSLRTYKVAKQKEKRFGVGPQIGVGISSNLTPCFFVGVGFNYSLFKF